MTLGIRALVVSMTAEKRLPHGEAFRSRSYAHPPPFRLLALVSVPLVPFLPLYTFPPSVLLLTILLLLAAASFAHLEIYTKPPALRSPRCAPWRTTRGIETERTRFVHSRVLPQHFTPSTVFAYSLYVPSSSLSLAARAPFDEPKPPRTSPRIFDQPLRRVSIGGVTRAHTRPAHTTSLLGRQADGQILVVVVVVVLT